MSFISYRHHHHHQLFSSLYRAPPTCNKQSPTALHLGRLIYTLRTPHIPLLAAQANLRVVPSRRGHGRSAGHDDLQHAAIELGPDARHIRVVPKADPPFKVARTPRGSEERIGDDVQYASFARRERDLVPLVPREERGENVRCRRRLYRHVRALGTCGDCRGGSRLGRDRRIEDCGARTCG